MAESPRDIDELKPLLMHALEEIAGLKRENAALREEIARLKGLNGKPDIKLSGMEKNVKSRSGKKDSRKNPRRCGSKNDKLTIDEDKILKPNNIPEGSCSPVSIHETEL